MRLKLYGCDSTKKYSWLRGDDKCKIGVHECFERARFCQRIWENQKDNSIGGRTADNPYADEKMKMSNRIKIFISC